MPTYFAVVSAVVPVSHVRGCLTDWRLQFEKKVTVVGRELDENDPGYTVQAENAEEAEAEMRRRFLLELKEAGIPLPERINISDFRTLTVGVQAQQ